MRNEIENIFKMYVDCDDKVNWMEQSLVSYDFVSLARMQFIVEIEDYFNIFIDEADLAKINFDSNVNELFNSLEKIIIDKKTDTNEEKA